MMHKKETGGIILLFHCCQSRIIRSPKRFVPGALEEIAFRNIRSSARRNLQQRLHRFVYLARMSSSRGHIRFMAGDSWKGRWSTGRNDRQGESIEHGGIHCGVPRPHDLLGRCPRPPPFEMQRYIPKAAAPKKGGPQPKMVVVFLQKGPGPRPPATP